MLTEKTLKISVIMPVYNGLPYVKKAIDSILAQDYPVHEIIIIDDGSKDGTPEVLKSYGDRIITRRIPNSGGPAAPKNVGVEIATGDYLAFLDHDDVWFKNKLRVQAELIQKYPEVDFIGCNYVVRYSHLGFRLVKHYSTLKQKAEIEFNRPLKKHPFLLLLRENFVGTPSAVMVRKDLVKKVGPFRADHGPCDDYSFFIGCAVHSNFILVSDLLFFKRTHKNALTMDANNIYRFHKKVLQNVGARYGDYMEQKGWKNAYRSAMAENHYILGNLAFERGHKGEAFENYRMGLQENPTIRNFFKYAWVCSKKIIRVLTFNTISMKSSAKA